MANYRKYFAKINTETPQTEPIPGEGQVVNNAGGYVWAVSDWTYLDRFLILGTEGGSYYASERKMTRDAAQAVERCIKLDGTRVVNQVVEISKSGRAPKNDPALFVLAMCAGIGSDATKWAAYEALPQVARIGTHLFHFAEYVEGFRGWGRRLRRAIGQWYTEKSPDKLALQLVKYQQREGWSHRDLLRLAHPVPPTPEHGAMFRWVIGKPADPREVARRYQKGAKPVVTSYPAVGSATTIPLIAAYEEAKTATEPRLVKLIETVGLPMEAIPTDKRTGPIYRALIPQGGLTWLFRNLGNLSRHGVLVKGKWDVIEEVTRRLTDAKELKQSRVHPIQVLSALCTYSEGHGARGKGEWVPVPEVVDALDKAFYLTFGNVEGAGKRTLIGLDISGSMSVGEVGGVPGLTPRIASSALCMVTYKTEPKCVVMGFTSEAEELDLGRYRRLDDIVKYTDQLPMGGTDCALPMLWALEKKVEVDTFVIYTDNETWAGRVHPKEAVNTYRREFQIPARLVVVGMTSTQFSIADPRDGGMLDVVGFDTATPQLITEFSAGRV